MYLLNELSLCSKQHVITTWLAISGFRCILVDKTRNRFDNIPNAFSDVLLARDNL